MGRIPCTDRGERETVCLLFACGRKARVFFFFPRWLASVKRVNVRTTWIGQELKS